MKPRTAVAAALAALTLAVTPVSASAQAGPTDPLLPGPAPAARADAGAPRQAISVNPLGAVFRVYAGELERRVAPWLSLGLNGSYVGGSPFDDQDDDRYTSLESLSVDAKLRAYPAGRALQGLSLGGTLGYAMARGELVDPDGTEKESAHGVAVGGSVDYN